MNFMKKLIISIISIVLLTGTVLADGQSDILKQAILLYKSANYQACQKEMQKIILNDPGNIIAHYYLAISSAALHNNDGAKKEYNSVISLDPNSQLASYAKLGLSYIEIPENVPEKISMKKEVDWAASLHQQGLNDRLSQSGPTQSYKDWTNKQESQNIDDKMATKNETSKQTNSSTPSQEEIAHAMAVLSKAGLNQNADPNMMQLNALIGGNGGVEYGMGNNSMNMLPLMMMYQNSGNGKNPDPEAIQMILSNMMMGSMNSMNFNSGNNQNY